MSVMELPKQINVDPDQDRYGDCGKQTGLKQAAGSVEIKYGTDECGKI